MIGIYVLLIILSFYLIKRTESFSGKKRVCNEFDNRCYHISTEFSDETHEKASEKLAEINKYLVTLTRYLRNKYIFNKNNNTYRTNLTKILLNNFDPNTLVENAPVDDVNTSYVEDKGIVFAMCLRERIGGSEEFHKDNILQFVAIHELSHLASTSYGHGDEFWITFKILLSEAKEAGLHNPVNYIKTPVNYCRLNVDYSPYFDPSVPVY